jgi:hypothetical protein
MWLLAMPNRAMVRRIAKHLCDQSLHSPACSVAGAAADPDGRAVGASSLSACPDNKQQARHQ